MTSPFAIRFTTLVLAIALIFSPWLRGQTVQSPALKPGTLVGTVVDVNRAPVPNATVDLKSSSGNDHRTTVTSQSGLFEFHVKPGVPYEITISAKDFANWTSPPLTLRPGQFKIVTGIQMRIPPQRTQVSVTYNPVQVATEQLKAQEKQRILGIIPNFYITYEKHPAPLTSKMKFQLAVRTSIDPVTIAGIFFVAALKQAANTPKYGQGWGAYGERVGAVTADGAIDILVGGAILPVLLHQDPRYFYQGTGTTMSRIGHATVSVFVTPTDSGGRAPNYSSLGGVLTAASMANLYYPQSDRGARLVVNNFAIGVVERIGANLAQEFILDKLTKRVRRRNVQHTK